MAVLEPQGSGELRESLRFDRQAEVDDGYGNKQGDWLPFIAKRRAKLTPTRGGEQVIAARLQGVAAFDCWVRSDALTRQLTSDDRAVDLRDPRRIFNIRFCQDMTDNRRWILLQLELGAAV